MKAWHKFPEEFLSKSWEVCGYKNIDDLQNVEGSINHRIAEFDISRIVQIMESSGGPKDITSIDYTENEIDYTDTKDPPKG